MPAGRRSARTGLPHMVAPDFILTQIKPAQIVVRMPVKRMWKVAIRARGAWSNVRVAISSAASKATFAVWVGPPLAILTSLKVDFAAFKTNREVG